MPSECTTGQYLEWCTDLPSIGGSSESPIFFLNGNEWIFRSDVDNSNFTDIWRFRVFLDLKNKHRDLEPCSVKCRVGFKKEKALSLYDTAFEVSHHYRIWDISYRALEKKLPPDYKDGNSIKFLFLFEGVTEPLLNLSKETGKSSSNLQLMNSNFCLENLSQDLGKMLHDGLNYDVEVKCNDHTWKVHKNILSIRSKVLQSRLNSDMIGHTRVITFEDMDVLTVQYFLDYLYSGKLPKMTVKTAKTLYEVGDKYAVDSLKKMCASYLVAYLTPENSFEILRFALQHSDFNFKEKIIQFIIKRKVFMIHDLWTDFRQSNKEIAFEVYDRFFKSELPK